MDGSQLDQLRVDGHRMMGRFCGSSDGSGSSDGFSSEASSSGSVASSTSGFSSDDSDGSPCRTREHKKARRFTASPMGGEAEGAARGVIDLADVMFFEHADPFDEGQLGPECTSPSSEGASSYSKSCGSRTSTPKVCRTFEKETPDVEGDVCGESDEERMRELVGRKRFRRCTREKQTQVARRIMRAMCPGFDPGSPSQQARLYKMMYEGGRWVKRVVSAFHKDPVVNMQHIVYGDGLGGKHFYTAADIASGEVVLLDTNPLTGVAVGTFDNGTISKSSSFFPLTVPPARLVAFFNSNEPYCRMENRGLYLFNGDGDSSFYVEVYYRNGGMMIHSAFPIYYFGDFIDGWELTLRGVHISGMDVAGALINLASFDRAIQYDTGGYLIIDLAKIFTIPGIPSGVYLRVNKNDHFIAEL
ncbi:hypothetical protein K0U07_00360 [bacterium]|nr:hypothetical protein [bacterium]